MLHLDIDTLPCPLVVTDEAGRIVAANQALTRVVGRSPSDWVGQPLDALLPPPSRIFLQTHAWPLLLHEQQLRELHLQLLGHEGTRVPVILNAQRMEGAGTTRYLWLMLVATERTRFEAELLQARREADEAAAALKAREHFLQNMVDGMPGLVAYWDPQLQCRFANHGHADWFGRAASDLVGMSMAELVGPTLFEQIRPHALAALAGQPRSFEVRVTDNTGTPRYHLNHVIPDISAAGRIEGVFVLGVDVSTLREVQDELRLAHSVVQNTAEAIMVTDAAGVVLSVNPAFSAITGYGDHEVVGHMERLIRADTQTSLDSGYDRDHTLATAGVWQGEAWLRRKDGELFVAWQTITQLPALDDKPLRYVTVFHDVTARWKDHEHLRHMALHDPLTGLANRVLLQERMQRLIEMNEREPRQFAVLFLDLDGFKGVNDALGHASGDTLLQQVAQRLVGLLRRSDTVARLGGDEFVILLDKPSDPTEVERLASHVLQTVSEPFPLELATVTVGVSVGVALFPQHSQDAESLLALADAALYQAKAAGKGVYRMHQPGPAA